MRLWMQGGGRRAGRSRPRTMLFTVLALALAALTWAVVALASGGPPTAVTEPATGVARASAVLEGTVNPHGTEVTECVFKYGTTPAVENSIPCSYSPGKGVTPVPVEASVSGLTESTTYYYEIFAKDAEGESTGVQRQLTTLPTAPHANTQAPLEVTKTSAKLEGLVTPNESEVTSCVFEWGTSPGSLTNTTACTVLPGSGTEPVEVSAKLEGLSESTTYYYRITATNAFGTDSGEKEQALTLPNKPHAISEPANPVGRTTALLKGRVTPRESLVEQCVFEWGTSPTEEVNTAPCTPSPGAGNEGVQVTAQLEGLSESTTYYFRVAATNVFGQDVSGGHQFTTEPTLPRAQTRKLDEIAARSAVFKGTVDPEGTTLTECVFEYGTTPAFGQSVPCSSLPSGESFTKVTARVTGLSPTTTYVYRVVATDSFGTDWGDEQRFTTFATGMLPTVTKLSPKKGLATGGTQVKIKGTNLLEAQSVSFGGVEAEAIVGNTAESVTAIAPPGAGMVDVTVTTPDGTSEISPGDKYIYGPASITTVSPGSGPIAGGTPVTVTGTGFLPGSGQTEFLFGKTPATSVVCASLNECTMITPAEPNGIARVVKVKAIVIGKRSKATPGAIFSYTP